MKFVEGVTIDGRTIDFLKKDDKITATYDGCYVYLHGSGDPLAVPTANVRYFTPA